MVIAFKVVPEASDGCKRRE